MSRTCIAFAITVSLLGSLRLARTESTPPIMPAVVETPLPPPVELPVVEAPEGVPNTPLTATEAAQIALLRQPSLTVVKMNVLSSQSRVQQMKAGLYPDVTLTGGYSDQVVSASDRGGGSDGFSTGANLRQLLFDYHRTREQVRQAAAQQRSSEANLTKAQSDLVLQVKQAYYTYVQNQRLVSVNEANLRNRQQHLAQARARLNAGVGLPIDVVRAETAVNDAIFNLNLARNTAAVSRCNLAQLMGLDPRTPIQVGDADEPAVQTDDLNALVEIALKQRPEMAQAQANLQANECGVNIAKTANAPSLVGTVGWGLRGSGFPPQDNTLTIGLAIQWSALDGGLTKGKIKEAQANLEAARAQLDGMALTIATDVAQAYLNVKTAEQRLITTEATVANAQEALRLAQGRYDAGLGTFLDVLDAQAALVTAQTNRVNAQSAMNQARAALAHALNNDPALAG